MKRVAAVAVVVAAGLAAAAIVAVRSDSAGGTARARQLIEQNDRFVNGPHAGATFADASRLLLSDAQSCARHRSPSDRRCAARFSAAAYTSVAAFALVRCTQPGVYRARRDMLTQLDAIVVVDHHHGAAPPPSIPAVPQC